MRSTENPSPKPLNASTPTSKVPLPGNGSKSHCTASISMANEDLFRRSFEQMDLRDLAYHSDSLKQTIEVEREALVQYGLQQVERIADTTGWYGSPQAWHWKVLARPGTPTSPPSPFARC